MKRERKHRSALPLFFPTTKTACWDFSCHLHFLSREARRLLKLAATSRHFVHRVVSFLCFSPPLPPPTAISFRLFFVHPSSVFVRTVVNRKRLHPTLLDPLIDKIRVPWEEFERSYRGIKRNLFDDIDVDRSSTCATNTKFSWSVPEWKTRDFSRDGLFLAFPFISCFSPDRLFLAFLP